MDSINRLELDVAERRVDPFLMSVLKSRFEAIVREMTLVVMRASRSAVIKNARDFSCAILTYDHRLVSVEDALPIHVMSMDMATRPLTEPPSATLFVSAWALGASSTMVTTRLPAGEWSPSPSVMSTAKLAVVLPPLVDWLPSVLSSSV